MNMLFQVLRTTAALMQLFWRRVLVAAVVCQFIGNADASTSSLGPKMGAWGLENWSLGV